MAKKQTRRTVSFNRARYDELAEISKEDNVAISKFVDEAVATKIAERRALMAPPPPPQADSVATVAG